MHFLVGFKRKACQGGGAPGASLRTGFAAAGASIAPGTGRPGPRRRLRRRVQ